MPDWLDIDFFQSCLLVAGTVLAYLAFRAESDARKDAAIERRLDLIAARVAELAAEATRQAEQPGVGWTFNVAKRNLRSALATAPLDLPKAMALVLDAVNPEAVRLSRGVSADEALSEFPTR